MVGSGGGVGCVVATEGSGGQGKRTVHAQKISVIKFGYNDSINHELPVAIEMTGAACFTVFNTPLLPTE